MLELRPQPESEKRDKSLKFLIVMALVYFLIMIPLTINYVMTENAPANIELEFPVVNVTVILNENNVTVTFSESGSYEIDITEANVGICRFYNINVTANNTLSEVIEIEPLKAKNIIAITISKNKEIWETKEIGENND